MTITLTPEEADELEQLLLDVVYDPDVDESDRRIDLLLEVLHKIEDRW